MATKKTGVPCYDKAAPDEPIFVIRAQDELSEEVVRIWAVMAEMKGVNKEKVSEALKLADEMGKWPKKKIPD